MWKYGNRGRGTCSADKMLDKRIHVKTSHRTPKKQNHKKPIQNQGPSTESYYSAVYSVISKLLGSNNHST